MTKVGLYIPCFNAAATIGSCLEAVLKQTFPLDEIVVVDDGSGDDTACVVGRYPARLIRHPGNQGLAAARNTAIKNMRAEFVASLDADCVAASDWLERLMGRFDSAQIAGAGGRLLEEPGTIFDAWRSVHMRQHWGDEEEQPPFLFGSNTVFRKEALVEVGLYNEAFRDNYEDVDISARLKLANYALAYEPQATARHLKRCDINSLFDTFWKWNRAYYEKQNYYGDLDRFAFKIKDNMGLANRYLEEDMRAGRGELAYLDFLLALHHSLRDFEYFISQHSQRGADIRYTPLLSWLVLLDLAYFWRIGSRKESLATVIPEKNASLQNYFALTLILAKPLQEDFPDVHFRKTLFKHLLMSSYRIANPYVLDTFFNLAERAPAWDALAGKTHPCLHNVFLKNVSSDFRAWQKNIVGRFPGIIRTIEASAEAMDTFLTQEQKEDTRENA